MTYSPLPLINQVGTDALVCPHFLAFLYFSITSPRRHIPSFGGAWGGFWVGLLPCLWSRVLFTPLSIRRGGGGEALFLLFTVKASYPTTGPPSSLFSFSFGSGVRPFFSSPFHSSHSMSTSDKPRVETRPLPAPR